MDKIYLNNNSSLQYGKGRFDDWCVYLVDGNGKRKAPRDIEYFTELHKYSIIFGKQKIYNDFIKIYDLTTNKMEEKVVSIIK